MKRFSMSKRLVAGLPVALALGWALATPLSQAQTTNRPSWSVSGPHGHHQGWGKQALVSIGATPEQQTLVQSIMQQARDDVRTLRKTDIALRAQLAQVLAAPNVDATAADSVRQKLLSQRDLETQRMLQARLQVAAALTPDQRQKLLAYQQQQQQRAKWQSRPAAAAG